MKQIPQPVVRQIRRQAKFARRDYGASCIIDAPVRRARVRSGLDRVLPDRPQGFS